MSAAPGAEGLARKLAQEEIRTEVVSGASKGLPAKVKSALTSLVAAHTTKLADCSNPEAYSTLKTTFSKLQTNLTAHNASIFAEDGARAKAAGEAKAAWLASQAAFRTAESAHKSAKSAATYAKGMYDKYSAAKEAGLAEYNEAIAPLNAEKEELTTTIPIIEMIQKMVEDIIAEQLANAGAAAKSGVQQLHMSSVPAEQRHKLAALAAQIVVPKQDKAALAAAVALRSMLQEAPSGTYVDYHMLKKVPAKIVASMEARLEEIAATTKKMQGIHGTRMGGGDGSTVAGRAVSMVKGCQCTGLERAAVEVARAVKEERGIGKEETNPHTNRNPEPANVVARRPCRRQGSTRRVGDEARRAVGGC